MASSHRKGQSPSSGRFRKAWTRSSISSQSRETWLLEVGADDPDYERGREFFSEREDRIRLAIVVAKCGYACAKAEAAVKNAVFDTDRNDPGTCWPQDTLQAIWRHKQALEVHLASQTDRPIRQYPRPATSR